MWVYASAAVTLAGATKQNGSALSKATTAVNTWQRLTCCFRATSTTTTLQLTAGSGVTFYVDDVSVMALSAVTLTCTPASLANSTETSGLRIDGKDLVTQTPAAGLLSATSGTLKWRWTQRHAAADVLKFGVTTPYILDAYGDANNWIRLYWSAANTVTLDIKCPDLTITRTWDATGAIVAGTTYTGELSYSSSQIVFKVDDLAKITLDMTFESNGLLNNLVAYWALDEAAGANDALDKHSNALNVDADAFTGQRSGPCVRRGTYLRWKCGLFYA